MSSTRPPTPSPSAGHGSFTIERTYAAPVARVFAAWCDIDVKARWFIGPPERWKLLERTLDLRVGGVEVLRGELAGGRVTTFTARYHEIVPDRRLVYAYDMHAGDMHQSVSLATVELEAVAGGKTRLTFTEQAVFLDGDDGTRSRDAGTAAHLDRLTQALGDPHEIVSSRTFDAPRGAVFAAFSDRDVLARWWGPADHRNTFGEFDFRAGGAWRFVMHAPDGRNHVLAKQFVDVTPARIVLRHLEPPEHRFTMTMTLVEIGARTHLVWRMRFDSVDEATKVRRFVAAANEQNLDRLAAVL